MRGSGEFQLSVLRRQHVASFISEVEHKCFCVQPCAGGQERKGQGVPRPTRFGRCTARLAGFLHPSHGGSDALTGDTCARLLWNIEGACGNGARPGRQ